MENPQEKNRETAVGDLNCQNNIAEFSSQTSQTPPQIQPSLKGFSHGFRKSKYFEVQIMLLIKQSCGFTVECRAATATKGYLPPPARRGEIQGVLRLLPSYSLSVFTHMRYCALLQTYQHLKIRPRTTLRC